MVVGHSLLFDVRGRPDAMSIDGRRNVQAREARRKGERDDEDVTPRAGGRARTTISRVGLTFVFASFPLGKRVGFRALRSPVTMIERRYVRQAFLHFE